MKILSIKSFNKVIDIPKDKSISHRAFLLSAIASGVTKIYNPLISFDTVATIEALKNLGVNIEANDNVYSVANKGIITNSGIITINAYNSGTTARLLSGMISGVKDCNINIIGDSSLSTRPMQRIVEPLLCMGANIIDNEGKLPLFIRGQQLQGITYNLQIASAQIKSAIILAALNATGRTIIRGHINSRNHTELMLQAMKANVITKEDSIEVYKSNLQAISFDIPSDFSSAIYFLVLAAIVKDSIITVKRVGINPTRTGAISVFDKCCVDYHMSNISNDLETIADITVKYTNDLKAFVINSELVPYLIDEIPILCVLACFCQGTSVISGASELRVKESNRIKAIVDNLTKMGADILETSDGLIIQGKGYLNGNCTVDSNGDHRIAMTMVIAALASYQVTEVLNTKSIGVSYPNFFDTVQDIID